MHIQIAISFNFITAVIAITLCIGTKDHIEFADDVTNSANRPFVNINTKETFYKYTTTVGDATEEEMNAVEFTSSYAPDDSGNTWLVSEELQPVIQMTKSYMDQFAGNLPTDFIGNEHYTFNTTYFDERIKQVRADPELLQQAHAWVLNVKQRLLDPSLRAKRDLEARAYTRCGPSRCYSERTCIAWNSWCTDCYNFQCNYYYHGIIDGC